MAITFSETWEPPFWASPYRLRFELGVGELFIPRFNVAYERARKLARAAINADSLFAIVEGSSDPASDPFFGPDYDGKSSFETLEELGVSTMPAEACWSGYAYPEYAVEPEAEPPEQRAVRVEGWQADILLWINIAREIAVRPIAPVLTRLVDRDREIRVFAYDDRGMDITALEPSRIAPLYKEFDEWLLDYDRPRMAEVFG